MADLCLVFKEASILFSRVVALACIPTVPTPVAGGVFDDGYSSMGEMESIFSCVFWPFEISSLRIFCLLQLPVFYWFIDFGRG
jgi:hypothetical protein